MSYWLRQTCELKDTGIGRKGFLSGLRHGRDAHWSRKDALASREQALLLLWTGQHLPLASGWRTLGRDTTHCASDVERLV